MITTKTIELERARIELREDGIVHVVYKEGSRLDLELQREIKSAFDSVSVGPVKKYMIYAEDFVSTEKNFWDSCRKAEKFARGQRTAVVAPNIAIRILARNYLTVYKPKNPFRIFGMYEEAVAWLNG